MEYKIFLIKICYCFILSFLIGLERLSGRHAIGLRTNVLVSIGAYLFVSFSFYVGAADLSRMAAQVVSGIGFLGAGVIMKDGTTVKGLTTAATLWCNAAIGVMCAGGLIIEAAIGCFFILFSNICLKFISNRLQKDGNFREDYLFKIKCDSEMEKKVISLISKATKNVNVDLTNIETKTYEDDNTRIYATLSSNIKFSHLIDRLMTNIMSESGVISVGWKKLEKTDDDIEDINEI